MQTQARANIKLSLQQTANGGMHRRYIKRPGLSGLAQVSGRNSIGWDDRFNLDVEYVDHVNFVNDWMVIFLTLKRTFLCKGINSESAATMEAFSGSPTNKKSS